MRREGLRKGKADRPLLSLEDSQAPIALGWNALLPAAQPPGSRGNGSMLRAPCFLRERPHASGFPDGLPWRASPGEQAPESKPWRASPGAWMPRLVPRFAKRRNQLPPMP